jgi:hypothetical protein
MRAPPVSPKYTSGWPLLIACSVMRCTRLLPISEEEPRNTVMSSPTTAIGRPSSRAMPPILPSPGEFALSSGRAERAKVPTS